MNYTSKTSEGILKQLVTGDSIQVNRKNKSPITMRPTAKMVFSGNDLPSFHDRSDGFWRRLVIIPFLQQIPAAQVDRTRDVRLCDELPGILNWALEGTRRLYRQGSFTVCRVCDSALAQYRHENDPVAQFVDEECTLVSTGGIYCDDLYRAFQRYCQDNGRRQVLGASGFGRQLQRRIGIARNRDSSGDRRYRYDGIVLRQRFVARYCNPPTRDGSGSAFASETLGGGRN